jgi:hypothetical protein
MRRGPPRHPGRRRRRGVRGRRLPTGQQTRPEGRGLVGRAMPGDRPGSQVRPRRGRRVRVGRGGPPPRPVTRHSQLRAVSLRAASGPRKDSPPGQGASGSLPAPGGVGSSSTASRPRSGCSSGRRRPVRRRPPATTCPTRTRRADLSGTCRCHRRRRAAVRWSPGWRPSRWCSVAGQAPSAVTSSRTRRRTRPS